MKTQSEHCIRFTLNPKEIQREREREKKGERRRDLNLEETWEIEDIMEFIRNRSSVLNFTFITILMFSYKILG